MRKGIDYPGVTVVFACHDGEGNFLFSKRGTACRDEQGTWDPGGGGLELGDTIEQTLRKEIREEYCTEVRSLEFLGVREVYRTHNGAPTHWIALDYKVLIDPSTVANGEPHKMDEIGWFTLDRVPNPVHSQFPHFLEKYRAKLAEMPA